MAPCPTGTSLLGGGFLTKTQGTPPQFLGAFPQGNGQSGLNAQWTVVAHAQNTAHSSVLVESIAVCSNIINTFVGQYVTSISTSGPLSATAACESGVALTGGGFGSLPTDDQPSPALTLSDDYPLMNGANAVWDVGWQASPVAATTLTLWSICGYTG